MAPKRLLIALTAPFALAACATTPGTATGESPVAGAQKAPHWVVADIAGKNAAALDKALGAPDLVRVEGKGEFRRYRLAECALLVVLYPDETGEKRAQSLDAGALTSGEEKPDLDHCLATGKPVTAKAS